MCCDAKTSRMGNSLPVDHDKVRHKLDLLKGLDNKGHFTEGKITGDIGEMNFTARRFDLGDRKLRPVQNNNGGFWLDGKASGRDIDPGDVAGVNDLSLFNNRRGEPLLDAACFFKDSPASYGAFQPSHLIIMVFEG